MKKIINEINKHFEMKITKKLLLFQELIYMSSATKKNDRITSQWYTDRTFQNQQNNETNFQKLLFFINETESEKTYLIMQTMSKKQVKTTQIIWETTIVRNIK